MNDGLLDTNPFIHAHSSDELSGECRAFLLALEQGTVRAHLEPLILHELSYALPHYVKQMSRQDVAQYLLMVLSWPGVLGEKAIMADAVERWRTTPRLAFVDSYLAALASHRQAPVYTKSVREMRDQGAIVPQPLPS